MHDAPVVPNEDVAERPDMLVQKSVLGGMRPKAI